MKFKTFSIISILCLSCIGLQAQYGILSCTDCTKEHLDAVKKGLAKKNRVDTIRSYHLLASYLYAKGKSDSSRYYLDIVQQMDSSYISKKYALLNQGRDGVKSFETQYFLFEVDESFRNAYVNNDIIETYLKSDTESTYELDDFYTQLEKLDQQYRSDWGIAIGKKNKILDDFKSTNTSFKHIEELEDSLALLQLTNDSLAVDFVLKKFESKPDYFKAKNSSSIPHFFLHSVKRIHELKPLLNYMLKHQSISLSAYSMYIDRYYCTKYDKAAFNSIHCKKDDLLQNLVGFEFPVFFKAYKAEKELN